MKKWSGMIQINGVSANVSVTVKSASDWNGSGTAIDDIDGELTSLYYTGRLAKTSIGSIAITGCKTENGSITFTFAGAGDPLMDK